MSLLPIGHTLVDIDEAFRSTSPSLRSNEAITLEELQAVLRKCFNEHKEVSSIKHCIKWSGLCVKTKALQKISNLKR